MSITVSPTVPQDLHVSKLTKTGPIGNAILATDVDHGSEEALYLGVVTPTSSNYSAEGDGNVTRFNGPSGLELRVTDQPVVTSDGTSVKIGVPLINLAPTVGNLPNPASFLYGTMFVSDAMVGAFDDVVQGGGDKVYRVHSDGVAWRIG
jgi:hypothetical protein